VRGEGSVSPGSEKAIWMREPRGTSFPNMARSTLHPSHLLRRVYCNVKKVLVPLVAQESISYKIERTSGCNNDANRNT
jgi:hypothetical protein